MASLLSSLERATAALSVRAARGGERATGPMVQHNGLPYMNRSLGHFGDDL